MTNHPYSGAALRRSGWHYLSGKAASGVITFAILLALVRILPIVEYGAYVTLIAVTELGYAVGGLGLQWMAARYLTEYRLHASGPILIKICYRLLMLQLAALVMLSLLLLVLGDIYLQWIGLQEFRLPALVFAVVLVLEGLGRFLREPIMGPLMLQGPARISLISRQLFFLILLVGLYTVGSANFLAITLVEAAVSAFALVVGLWLLVRHLNTLRSQSSKKNWVEPTQSAHWSVARRMYFVHLMALTYSPQVFINLIQRILGVEATALFGFLNTLQAQIARYLPATLLFSLIRPKLVAGYVGGGGMDELSRNANLSGKLSLFVLMPLVIFAALVGDSLIAWLSGGKFMSSGWLLSGFMLVLVPFSQRQLIESVAVASGHANLCAWAAASGLIMLPLMWIMLQLDLGLWAAVIAIGLGHLLFNSIVVAGVSKRAGYQADWVGFVKLVVSALVAYGVSMLLHLESADTWIPSWLPVVLQCALAMLVYLAFAWWVKPFAASERGRINALIKRRIFVW